MSFTFTAWDSSNNQHSIHIEMTSTDSATLVVDGNARSVSNLRRNVLGTEVTGVHSLIPVTLRLTYAEPTSSFAVTGLGTYYFVPQHCIRFRNWILNNVPRVG